MKKYQIKYRLNNGKEDVEKFNDVDSFFKRLEELMADEKTVGIRIAHGPFRSVVK
ncbi:MAG: hypothetical protein GYA55_03785 [SAR324 cluster bacterium]|uniref:Uncharacterized protein n=1 Tax=SAR324 cluster bacterium TaxID=2024889 RepID=A0A7X9FR04_9DELT|nr:hypothetical protein [SAR324 cluster bacterium]